MRLKPSLNFGNKNETNPTIHCKPNNTTADKPTHECKEYIFGIGLIGLLCESKTAFKAIEAKINTAKWIMPCKIFTYNLVVVLKSL